MEHSFDESFWAWMSDASAAFPQLPANEPLPGEADVPSTQDDFNFDPSELMIPAAPSALTPALQVPVWGPSAASHTVDQCTSDPQWNSIPNGQASGKLQVTQSLGPWDVPSAGTFVPGATDTSAIDLSTFDLGGNPDWDTAESYAAFEAELLAAGPPIDQQHVPSNECIGHSISAPGATDTSAVDPSTFDLGGNLDWGAAESYTAFEAELPAAGPPNDRQHVPSQKRTGQSISSEVAETIDSRPTKRRRYAAEAPKLDEEKRWVRKNQSTIGNTRTGKTNNFGHGDYNVTTAHPLGTDSWTSPATGNVFRYNQWGELMGVSFDAEVLSDFLTNHPFNKPGYKGPGRLILWIQKMPGDSARRVETQYGLKCRVRECPTGIYYQHRTINAGHYRVAFDEQWAVHGMDRNPMHVAGYVHLYCMERFFDFGELCRRLDVRVDDREIDREPNGQWTAGLRRGTEEWTTAQNFVDFMRTGECCHGKATSDDRRFWARYPAHDPFNAGQRKPHEFTLTSRLIAAKEKMTGRGKMRMMTERPISGTQYFVNRGDLEVQIHAQQEKAAQKREEREQKRERGEQTRKRKRKDLDAEEEEVEAKKPEKRAAKRRIIEPRRRLTKNRGF